MLIAIMFMYVCVLALVPFFGFAVYLIVTGDQMRARGEVPLHTIATAPLPIPAGEPHQNLYPAQEAVA